MKEEKSNLGEKNETNNHEKVKQTEQSFPIYRIFRFADRQDFVMIIFAGLCSLAAGACLPISFYLLIQFDNTYLSSSKSEMQSKGYQNMLTIIYLGIAAFFCNWSATTLWIVTGERQSSQCKKAYYSSLLYQNAEFYDCNEHSLINSKFTIDADHFQRALGQKIGLCLQFLGNMVSALAISLSEGWLMSILMIACAALVLLVSLATMSTIKQKESMFLKFYSQAGGRAEEVISSIKTVKQFNAESFELNLFEKLLAGSKTEKIYSIVKIALSIGLVNALVYIMYSFAFWYGGNCLKGTNVCFASQTGTTYTAENVHIISNLIILCLVEFTLLAPALKQVVFGKEAAQRIFKIIDYEPKIQIRNKGIRLDKLEGKVEFRNVSFSYPKNKNRKILDGLSLTFDLHSSALVGESGCGKSTIIQLLMRVYDHDEGEILIDGHNLREIDVMQLRSQIGYVGQEPVLFAGTIRENLLFANPEATEEQISQALKQAEVHKFVLGLQHGLDTYVGVGGGQVSGGQKQRIAIARALIKNPQLLILDEATSALDRTNQRLIQDTLNKISESLMTVTIAHRLSTIISSNKIFVIAKGKLEEQGKFSDLKYFKAKKQAQQKQSEEEQEEHDNNQENIRQNINLCESIRSSQSLNIDLPDLNGPKMVRRYSQLKREKENQLVSKYKSQMFWRIFSFNSNKRLLYAFSIIINIAIGLLYPIFAIFSGKVYIFILDFHTNVYSDPLADIYEYSLYILLMGITAFTLFSLQSLCGQTVGDEVSNNLRSHTYGKILKMPISWFDKRENTCGAISSRLSVECQKVKDLLTTYIYLIVRSFTTFTSGVVIMFIYQWKFALIIFGFVTLLIASSIAKSFFKTKLTKQLDLVSLKTNGIVQESLMNIRTVASFNMQEILISKYEKQLKGPSESLVRIGIVAGLMNGLGYIIVIMVFGILSYIAILMMIYDGANAGDIITTILQFYFMSITLSRNFSYLPDVEETSISIANIFSVLDAQDEEQIQDRLESKRLKSGFDGDIEIKNLSFKYEERNKNVLTNLNLKIRQGDKVAFVGASGCGKSTLFQLLLRFYEPTSGMILVGGTPLQDFDIAYIRSQFGVVGQQPVVFNSSFRENICYNTTASEQQMRDAAVKANAIIFIEGKQRIEQEGGDDKTTGFNRNVGARGFHISGGQKQRVAIARVLLRNPKILLLDEATSALDAQNERQVQHSLDFAMEGRTTVTVAHRIETIKNSNQIHVFSRGKVAESGVYSELIEYKGLFWKIQMGNKK